jgi:hypothetical protein
MNNKDSFSEPVQAEWSEADRDMKLLRLYSFTDGNGRVWNAAAGEMIDGASIPKPFWSIVGGPYEGKYRNASVVHDVECRPPHTGTWRQAHRMFHEACLVGGVGKLQAALMYAAVFLFGPKWEWPSGAAIRTATCSADDAVRTTAWIRDHPNATLDDIDALSPAKLRKAVSDRRMQAERKLIVEHRLPPKGVRFRRDPLLDG